MSKREVAHKIEELQTKAKMTNSLQGALYISIFCQEIEEKSDFEWAFTLLGIMTNELAEELKELTECIFKDYRKKKT